MRTSGLGDLGGNAASICRTSRNENRDQRQFFLKEELLRRNRSFLHKTTMETVEQSPPFVAARDTLGRFCSHATNTTWRLPRPPTRCVLCDQITVRLRSHLVFRCVLGEPIVSGRREHGLTHLIASRCVLRLVPSLGPCSEGSRMWRSTLSTASLPMLENPI